MSAPARTASNAFGELPGPLTDQRVQSGRCPQGSLNVSGRFRRTPGAAITYRVAGSCTFAGAVRVVV